MRTFDKKGDCFAVHNNASLFCFQSNSALTQEFSHIAALFN